MSNTLKTDTLTDYMLLYGGAGGRADPKGARIGDEESESGKCMELVRVLGGRQQNYAFASSLEPKLVKTSPQGDVIAVASAHCHLWFQYAPSANVRVAFYDAATLHPLHLFDLLCGPRVEHLAWHPTKPIVAMATSMVPSSHHPPFSISAMLRVDPC